MTWKNRASTAHPELETELAKVREAAPPPPAADDPIYRYLRQVYRLRFKIAHAPKLQTAIKSEHATRFPNTVKNYAGVIIELTAPHVTSKSKHKYLRTSRICVQPRHRSQALCRVCEEAWRHQQVLRAVGQGAWSAAPSSVSATEEKVLELSPRETPRRASIELAGWLAQQKKRTVMGTKIKVRSEILGIKCLLILPLMLIIHPRRSSHSI